jgi:hypothetical protein
MNEVPMSEALSSATAFRVKALGCFSAGVSSFAYHA